MNVDVSTTVLSPTHKGSALLDQRSSIAAAVRQILIALGEDPEREGLRNTPLRVAKMYEELFSGMAEDPRDHLRTQFSDDGHEGIVIVKDIDFHSVCEHHMVPFYGKVHVAYVPRAGRLTGLSKIARVVQTVSRRPQLQERLNTQVVDAIWDVLKPEGVLAVVEAMHMCMVMRGVRSPNSSTLTVVSRGTLETNAVLRAETLKLLRE
jgi:GTP cyclohydrolase IA